MLSEERDELAGDYTLNIDDVCSSYPLSDKTFPLEVVGELPVSYCLLEYSTGMHPSILDRISGCHLILLSIK